jgi:hypothetical protein
MILHFYHHSDLRRILGSYEVVVIVAVSGRAYLL